MAVCDYDYDKYSIKDQRRRSFSGPISGSYNNNHLNHM